MKSLRKNKRQNVRFKTTNTAARDGKAAFLSRRKYTGNRTIICSVEAIRPSRELEGKTQAEANIVVAIARAVVVAIGSTAVPGIVVPATAADHAISTL